MSELVPPAPVPAAVPAETASDPVVEPAENSSPDTVLTALAALIAIGAGAWAVLAMRRRSPKGRYVAEKIKPMPVGEPERQEEPAARQAATPVPLHTARPVAAPRHGAAVALPKTMPATFEERDSLLKRMVEAKPDRANPFRSRKARLHRARLILQSLGQKFERRDPWIDLSQYPDVWPELAQRRMARAA